MITDDCRAYAFGLQQFRDRGDGKGQPYTGPNSGRGSGGYGGTGYGDGNAHGGGDGDSQPDINFGHCELRALFNPTRNDFVADVIYANIFGARS